MTSAPLTVGTAGHVDHGKTTLVTALTGKNTDRLAEEKRRGLSIELGYAELALPSGRRLSLVDVPGHERFIRTMVAGATGVDLFLLCVAADDGVMPQTSEHVRVLRALGVERGVVAITKTDVARPDRALGEVAALLPGAEAVPVAAPCGEGLADLLEALDRVAAAVPSRADAGRAARLHVDRSFTINGIGTVVTGTLWSGRLEAGGRVKLLPQDRDARVRSLQIHDRPVGVAAAGQRVAVALAGVRREEVRRGDVVCDGGAAPAPSFVVDASVTLEPGARPLDSGTRVHVHHGTREAPARVKLLDRDRLEPGATARARLRLEAPLIAERGDRLVVRQVAPPDTVGGGTVIEPRPRRWERAAAAPSTPSAAGARSAPAELGPAARRLAELLEADGERPRSDGDLERGAAVEAGEAACAWRELEAAGVAIRTGRSLHFAAPVLARLGERVLERAQRDGGVSIAAVRDDLGSTRRHAQAVLEHLDARKLTVRQGDLHVPRRAGKG